MLITNEQIEIAKQKGACKEALSWLQEEPRTWQELAEYCDEWFEWDAYTTKLCPCEVLDILSLYNNLDVRASVARHPNSSVKILNLLSKDKSSYVRSGVALNKNTPFDTLYILSDDSDEYVKEMIVTNLLRNMLPTEADRVRLNNSIKILSRIMNNSSYKVKILIAKYIRILPEEIQIKLIKDDNEEIRRKLASNRDISYEMANILAYDSDFEVRRKLAIFTKFPKILNILINDPDEEIVREAYHSIDLFEPSN